MVSMMGCLPHSSALGLVVRFYFFLLSVFVSLYMCFCVCVMLRPLRQKFSLEV